MAEEENNRPWLIGKFWEEVQGFFLAMFRSVWSGFPEIIRSIANDTWNTLIPRIEKGEALAASDILERVHGLGLIDKDTVKELKRISALPFPFGLVVTIISLAPILSTYIQQATYAIGADTRRKLFSQFTPERPDPGTMMSAVFTAPEKATEVRQKMREQGLDDDDIDLYFLSRYKLYDENTVRTLWLRGALTEDQMFMRMRELGYTDTRIKEIIQGWSVIPGPTDLFHLVAKEAFEPDAIKEMGLDAEFPVEQLEWLKKQGLSEEWGRKYWYAHWEMPSIQMGFEMLHRGIINHDQLDTLFRTVEIPPYWRDKLTAIAYAPYTRVDVRRMHDLGIIDDAGLVKAYMDLGYDEEHAIGMAKFTIRYNQQTDKSLTKSEIIKGYNKKALTKKDAHDLLVDLEYSEAQAEYILLLEDYKEAEELQDDIIGVIKERYQGNLIDAFNARRRLNELNLPAVEVDMYMDKWEVHKAVDVKLPSKSDLDKFLAAGIITNDIYRQEMDKLGYNFKYIEWYEKLSQSKGGKK